jgi:progressive ankylosis protein
MNPQVQTSQSSLTLGKLFRFWSPLYATWFMMAVEGPFLAAVIARLPGPKFNLAAYGVAFAFALIIEAPVIMMMSASNALVDGWPAYVRLRNFTFALMGIVTVAMLLFLIPPVFFLVTGDLMGLPEAVARITYKSLLLLLPWPGAIGYRRFYQGLLIRHNATRRVAYGTVVRLSAMAATASLLAAFTALEGACVGAAALSAGVTAEALASRWMAREVVASLRRRVGESDSGALTYSGITRFYFPLALTSLLGMGVQPIITFFLGRSRFAIESLAVLPVINSLVFVFRSVGLSLQDVAIANMGNRFEGYAILRRFAIVLGCSAAAGLALIAFTPISSFWFGAVSGLSPELAAFAVDPTRILVLMPALSVLLSFQHAILVHAKTTTPITWGTVVEVFGIVAALAACVAGLNIVGAVAASIALMFGRIAANAFLLGPMKMVAREGLSPRERAS